MQELAGAVVDHSSHVCRNSGLLLLATACVQELRDGILLSAGSGLLSAMIPVGFACDGLSRCVCAQPAVTSFLLLSKCESGCFFNGKKPQVHYTVE